MKTTSTLTSLQLLQLIQECRNAELFRDMEMINELIQPIWDTESNPDFSNFDEEIQAELYRISGFYISFYGHQRGLKNYQIKGKDLLSRAVQLFEKKGLIENADESRVMLAFAFWNNGEVEECEIILNEILNQYSENPQHPINFQIVCNKLMTLYWSGRLKEAETLISKNKSSLKSCRDVRLLYMFHNQAGIIYQSTKKIHNSEYHYKMAIQFAKKACNLKFVAINFNNLAMLQRDLENYDEALKLIEESEELSRETDFIGFLPHVLDTKSLIYQSLQNYHQALTEIDKSIEIFRKGEDYRGFVEALWTKIICLIKLGRKEEVLRVYCELHAIAAERIGKTAIDKFEKLMSDQFLLINEKPLEEGKKSYLQSRVSYALRASNGVLKKAAQILGIDRGMMSDIVSNQFPVGTFVKDGYNRRQSRGTTQTRLVDPKREPQEKIIKFSSKKIKSPKKIAKILFANMPCTFDFDQFENFEVFLIPSNQMKIFGINYDCFIAAETSPDFNDGDLLLLRDRVEWILGKAEFDEENFIYFVTAPNGGQIEIELSNLAGKPIAYCPYSDNLTVYNFTKLN